MRRRSADESQRYETEIGSGRAHETQLLVSMLNVIARREGRDKASPVIRDTTNHVGPHSMRAMYQVDELVECEGDVFDDFKQFHMAMFDMAMFDMAMFDTDRMQTVYRNTHTDSGDSFTSTVDHCDACEFRFYRKGTAPDTEPIDGVEVTWEPSLNRQWRNLRSEVDNRTGVR